MWAQALIEKGMLDSVAAGASALKYQVALQFREHPWLWIALAIFLIAISRPFWRS
jgi:hypothetical protein